MRKQQLTFSGFATRRVSVPGSGWARVSSLLFELDSPDDDIITTRAGGQQSEHLFRSCRWLIEGKRVSELKKSDERKGWKEFGMGN